ncbi:hypothetical protein I7I51_08334 [Histoplasma capsulatum]|uniref:Uncharacterized protein n=1 Tax=Ajellomyces capsulatus TaxID=5037 RepID=A0A8A1M2K3_AJECA|nr:hypothetical protein I7I51_08334 [Histoplasma capsulatum]
MLGGSGLLAVRRRSKNHLSDLFEDRLHLYTTQRACEQFDQSFLRNFAPGPDANSFCASLRTPRFQNKDRDGQSALAPRSSKSFRVRGRHLTSEARVNLFPSSCADSLRACSGDQRTKMFRLGTLAIVSVGINRDRSCCFVLNGPIDALLFKVLQHPNPIANLSLLSSALCLGNLVLSPCIVTFPVGNAFTRSSTSRRRRDF